MRGVASQGARYTATGRHLTAHHAQRITRGREPPRNCMRSPYVPFTFSTCRSLCVIFTSLAASAITASISL